MFKEPINLSRRLGLKPLIKLPTPKQVYWMAKDREVLSLIRFGISRQDAVHFVYENAE